MHTSLEAFNYFSLHGRQQTIKEEKAEKIEDIGSNTQCASMCEILYIEALAVVLGRESLQSTSFECSADTHQRMLVLSVEQTMQGKLDKRDLLQQELLEVWAMRNINLIPIIYGVLGFPDGVFEEHCVSWLG